MHELTLRANGRAEMAFVGETPWHGLGQSITKGASLGVWAKEAGMDWEALEGRPGVTIHSDDGIPMSTIAFPEHKALWRSDTKEPLAIVGSNYNVVQPCEVLEFFREMTEHGGWHIHTAGTLRGGRRLWAMASNGEGSSIGGRGKDEVMQNVVMATSLDGSMKTTVALTAVRVVCANTLALALDNRADANIMRISHRSIFDKQAVMKTLGLASYAFEAFMEQARELAETSINMEEARHVLGAILDPKREEKRQEALKLSWMGELNQLSNLEVDVEDNRTIAGVLDLFGGLGMGANMKTAKGTRWGLLNAVTQYVDHAMGRSDDTRLDSAFFGRGADLKKQAFVKLTA